MSTLFPASLDSFNNPGSSSNLNDPGVVHHEQHANANDAIEAIEAKLGITDSLDVTSVDYKLRQLQGKVTYGTPPLTPLSTGTQGAMVYSSGYLYLCIDTDTWVRFSAITSW